MCAAQIAQREKMQKQTQFPSIRLKKQGNKSQGAPFPRPAQKMQKQSQFPSYVIGNTSHTALPNLAPARKPAHRRPDTLPSN